MAAGDDDQSSWIFSPVAPARICSTSEPGVAALPLPKLPKLSGMSAIASSMRWMLKTPGHSMPTVFGPEPPPITVVKPAFWYS